MPAPDIYLTKPKVMLTESQTGLSITPNDGSLRFGIVVSQYETSPWVISSAPVLFDPKGAQIINYGNVDYYIIDESKILFRETPPVILP